MLPACWTNIHVHLTILVVTLYVLSLHWYQQTVIHVNQPTGTHLVLRNHNDCGKLLPHKWWIGTSLVPRQGCGCETRLVPISLSLQRMNNELMTSTSKYCYWVIWHDLWPLTIKILVQILSTESSPWSSPESRFCTVPAYCDFCPPIAMTSPLRAGLQSVL